MVKGKGKQICMILALVGLLTGCGSQSKVPDDYATNEGKATRPKRQMPKLTRKQIRQKQPRLLQALQKKTSKSGFCTYPIPPKEAAIPTRMILAFRECRKISGCPPIRLCARS